MVETEIGPIWDGDIPVAGLQPKPTGRPKSPFRPGLGWHSGSAFERIGDIGLTVALEAQLASSKARPEETVEKLILVFRPQPARP